MDQSTNNQYNNQYNNNKQIIQQYTDSIYTGIGRETIETKESLVEEEIESHETI